MERVYPGVPLMIDHTQVDVLVKASRLLNDQTTNAAIRPWLTLCWEPDSRVVVFSLLSERNPDQKTVEAVICAVLSHTEKHHRSDVRQEITVGNKTYILTQHVQQLADDVGITADTTALHPHFKGGVERFFLTLNTRLWSTLPGYIGDKREDCSPESELTLDELDAIFTAFLDQYHHQVNIQTGNTPLAHWYNQIVPKRMAPDRAEELLKGSLARRVGKHGIAYAGRKYWHEDLAAIVGRDVIIRVDSHGALPSSIDVFYQNQWFCSAFLNASKEA